MFLEFPFRVLNCIHCILLNLRFYYLKYIIEINTYLKICNRVQIMITMMNQEIMKMKNNMYQKKIRKIANLKKQVKQIKKILNTKILKIAKMMHKLNIKHCEYENANINY